MIAHVILCLNEREIEKKKREKRETINQEDQISELTFNFHGALSILNFSENELTIFIKKSKIKTKKEEKKSEIRRKEKKERKEKSFCLSPMSKKSILCGINFKILISKFSSM